MRKYSLTLLAAAAIGLVASAASAADLPRKAPAYMPPTPPFSWTGFYIGINGGGGWGTVETTINGFTLGPPPAVPIVLNGLNLPLASQGVNGWLFGGQIGYNYQAAPWLVLGIEGEGDWANISGNAPCGFGGIPLNCNAEVRSFM
jgi:outer membrane immunogenic protein